MELSIAVVGGPAVASDAPAADAFEHSYWRLISGLFAKALRLASDRRTPQEEIDLSWLVNGHLYQAGVEDFLEFRDGQPRILHSAGGLYEGWAPVLRSVPSYRRPGA